MPVYYAGVRIKSWKGRGSIEDLTIVYPLFDSMVSNAGEVPESPKQLNIETMPSYVAVKLNELWHSSMPVLVTFQVCKPCFAAVYANRYYAVALWSLPIAANRLTNGFNMLELRRFAIAENAPFNTATYMIARMAKYIKQHYPKVVTLISYQDTGAHVGTIYKAANWQAVAQNDYVSWGEHSDRPGRIEQSTAPKVRWEYKLRD